LRIIKLRLTRRGFEVMTFETALEALARLQNNASGKPDLIICDIMMPGMDGYEFCRKVRELGIEAPFLFLSSKSASEDKVRGISTGADDYITKPFDPIELEAKIAARLSRQ
ncbi:response regulator transcription factor, partial [Elusimicrobiota bacterium]